MKKWLAILLSAMLLVSLAVCVQAEETEKLVFGYITPGPDTWYLRDEEGFKAAAEQLGIEVVVLNSNYDVSQELANIENLINQGVDGIGVFSFNENGAITCAEQAAAAGIPVVAIDSVGSVFDAEAEVAAAVDFDWNAMGIAYGNWMATNCPGEDYVIITGNFESVPCQVVNEAMQKTSEELGQNKCVTIESANYTPSKAADIAEDLVNSGEKFKVFFVMDEDMAAAVILRLEDLGVKDDYVVIAQNGSDVGIELIKQGTLAYTISSSPGWEGFVAALALNDAVVNEAAEPEQHLYLPIIEVTPENIDDPQKVIPWTVDVELFTALTGEYFPALAEYLK